MLNLVLNILVIKKGNGVMKGHNQKNSSNKCSVERWIKVIQNEENNVMCRGHGKEISSTFIILNLLTYELWVLADWPDSLLESNLPS